MRGYFGLGQLSAAEKSDILDQHKSLYNGYQTMQPQVSNTQPLYTYDFAGDKDGLVVNNKGEVKKYTNMGINEQVEGKEMCEQCGGRMTEGICEQCGSGDMEEGVGKLDDIYDVNDLGDNDFDYVEGGGNDYGTFEKMHHMKKIKSEGEYEDDDNEDDDNEDDAVVGSEDLQIDSSEMYEDETDGKPYEMGKRGMKASRARASFIPSPQENEIINNLFGQYGEDIPPIVIRYLRKLPRKTLLNRLVRVGLIDKDLLKGSETIEEQGGNAPDMDVSGMDSAYNFRSDGPGDVYPTEGEMEEQSPEDNMRYRRRGIIYKNLLTFIEYEKDQFDTCQDFGDEFEYADNIITAALDSFFIETEQELRSDFYFEVHDLCKDWFGEDLITEYMEECGGQEEEEEEDFMFMESAFADEIDEVDVSGSQGIYGEMDPPYDFDSEGPGKAGPYQRSSYNEEEIDEMEVENEEEFEIDEDLQESFHNQKNKITEMMSRMKIIK